MLSAFYASSFLGILLLAPLSLIEYLVMEEEPVFSLTSAGILLYVGFLASIMAFLSWNFGVSLIGAAKAGVFLNLLPVFAIIFALYFTEVKLYLYQLIGGGIVILGVVISSAKTLRFKDQLQENKFSA